MEAHRWRSACWAFSPQAPTRKAGHPRAPINLLIAFSAGGSTDTQARLIAEQIEADTGWKIIPEQVTGAGGVNALRALRNMPADGTAIAIVISETLGYDLVAAEKSRRQPRRFRDLDNDRRPANVDRRQDRQGLARFQRCNCRRQSRRSLSFRFRHAETDRSCLFAWQGQRASPSTSSPVKGGKAVMNGVQAGDLDFGFMAGSQTVGVASGELVDLASALSVPLKTKPRRADAGRPWRAIPRGWLFPVCRPGRDAARGAVRADPRHYRGGGNRQSQRDDKPNAWRPDDRRQRSRLPAAGLLRKGRDIARRRAVSG